MKKDAGLKRTIGYHRSYRRISLDAGIFRSALINLLFVAGCATLKLWFADEFTYQAAVWLKQIFGDLAPQAKVIRVAAFDGLALFALQTPIAVPSRDMCLVALLPCFLGWMLADVKSFPRPLLVSVNVLVGIVGFFALLFLQMPQMFRPEAIRIDQMFMQVSVVAWIGLPFFLWFVLIPVPKGSFKKFFALVIFELSLMAVFVVKYMLFILLCLKGTYLVVPLVVLFLCSQIDVLYMICLYSLLLGYVANGISKQSEVWHWS